jgi:hypothetical protein
MPSRGQWLSGFGATRLHIKPDLPGENDYYGSFSGKLRDELLNGKIFCSFPETKGIINQCAFIIMQRNCMGSSDTVRQCPSQSHRQPHST